MNSTNSPLARVPDRALRWTLTILSALILALIVYFFIRLFDESRPAFEQQGVLSFIFEDNWNPGAGQLTVSGGHIRTGDSIEVLP